MGGNSPSKRDQEVRQPLIAPTNDNWTRGDLKVGGPAGAAEGVIGSAESNGVVPSFRAVPVPKLWQFQNV